MRFTMERSVRVEEGQVPRSQTPFEVRGEYMKYMSWF